MHSRTPFTRVAATIMALLAAALACNLQVGGDTTPLATMPGAERPTVEILEPAEGATFSLGQVVSVRARAAGVPGVTLVELLVNGVRVASQPPADAISPSVLEVVLDYQPDRAGTFMLAVRAYSNTIVGQPAQRTITVLPQLSPGTGGQPGTPQIFLPPTSTPYNPVCRARVNTGLNFRAGPGIEYGILRTFSAGEEPQITGYADRPDGRWWQVLSGGQTGWIKESYTTQLGDCMLIRPAVVPASPTPVPSATPPPTAPGTTATPTLPDLALSMLEGVAEVQLGADGTAQATYIIRVRNGGGQVSAQFRIAVLKPNGQVDFYDVPGLNPGQEFQVPSAGLIVTFNTPGLARILVTVDDLNQVAESNEGNNQAYKDITVIPGPPTVTPPPTQPPPPTAPPQTNLGVDATGLQPEAAPAAAAALSAASQPVGVGGAQLTEIAALWGHGGMVTGLAFSPAGGALVSSSRDGTVRVWDAYAEVELITLVGHTDRVLDAAFSPDGARVASASWDGTVRVWDSAAGTEVAALPHGAQVDSVAFSPDGSRIASGGRNPDAIGGLSGLVRVWDVNSEVELAAIETYGPVTGVAFLGSATLAVATAGKDCDLGGGLVEVFEIGAPDTPVLTLEGGGWLSSLAVDPISGQIAAGGPAGVCSGNAIVWVWGTGGALRASLDHGSSAAITGIAFDPGGNVVTTTTADGTLRVWDLVTGTPLAVAASAGELDSVAFSPDGVRVASGGADGAVRLWLFE